ncbi:MAG: tetratricopeptide repeat protein [Planctomycetes bacterium]|nr:tetratricopeptide repeat protein [Planctomycetota bacterium]
MGQGLRGPKVTRLRAGGALAAALWLAALPSVSLAARPPKEKERELSHGPEVQFTNEEFKALDTFEGHSLTKADKVFAARDYKRAAAEYDSFILEFPKSRAVAYALLRKARCLHLSGKRFEAIKEYREVLDYFPNAVKYAAPAIYYTGVCHWENADEEDAMKAWAKMAEDAGYSQHPLAATAIARLADHIAKEGRPDKAVAYHEQVAANFRRSNPEAAKYAIEQVVAHYVRTQPDEAKLRAFYLKVGGFGPVPERVEADVEKSHRYWGALGWDVRRLGQFAEAEAGLRDRYYRYWTGLLDGKFPEWDDFQLNVIHLKSAYEKDMAKWQERVDQLFERNQKPGDYARIIRWIGLFPKSKAKVMEYYNKLAFEKMTNGQIRDLMKLFYERVDDAKMARNLFGKLRLDEMSDGEKAELAKYFWPRDAGLVKDICMSFDDKELGQMEYLRFHHSRKDAKQGVPLADQMAKVPRFAADALWLKAQLLHWSEQYPAAIAAYQQCNNPPQNIWPISECYVKMGKIDQAVAQLREVEAFFKPHAPEAALRIANLYREAGMKPQQIAALRAVLKKYPESPQSSSAHEDLERMGIKMGGGVDTR